MAIVYRGEIGYSQFLDPTGTAVTELPNWTRDPEILRSYYRNMVLARQFDTKAIALQRTGQLGTFASMLGGEAIDVVTSSLMAADDVLVPYYRNHASQLIRGMSIEDVLAYWGGDERGNAADAQGQDFPNSVPIATQALHATGVATAFKIRNEKRVAVTFCGDGATSKGDFLEAINLAGVWQLPVVFVVNNNQWAISVPRALQCNAETLAQKAIGAGIHGEQVDGNDVIALHEAVEAALERARQGKGPSMIEALSYRLADHTTADDATRYRQSDELKRAWEHEPIKRLQTYLHSVDLWNELDETAWLDEVNQIIQRGVERYLNREPQPLGDMFDYLYAELPASLKPQRDRLLQQAEEGGTHHE